MALLHMHGPIRQIGFFIGNAGKSRGQSPRYLCKSRVQIPDDRLQESEHAFDHIIL